jgi:hypothetical protein
VGLWTYFNLAAAEEGTTPYMDGQPPYMEWIWEIPIHSNVLSVGYVAAGDAIKEKRQLGLTVDEIFRERIARIPRLSALAPTSREIVPHVTSFQCRVFRELAGPNWLIGRIRFHGGSDDREWSDCGPQACGRGSRTDYPPRPTEALAACGG